ncbi:hypothetical protein DEO72_LG5g1346 [Vigna unguiculata]|uniref:Uncharacterized protein n=1 Tax=Vigna unguiculata TaxID=3917 RepID=A0A4D6LZM3_VIGUN|nr:hypothetical protein DEO72_LG5g1346 [Vigna unguiculata]
MAWRLQRNQSCTSSDTVPGGGYRPLGDFSSVSEVWCEFCLAGKVVSPGGYGKISGFLVWMRSAVRIVPPGGVFNCWWF